MSIVIILLVAFIFLLKENTKICEYPAITDWNKYTVDQLELTKEKLAKNHKEGKYSC